MVRLCYIHVHLDLLIIDQVEPSRYIIQCGPSPVKAACIQAISLQIIQSHARHPPSSSFPAPDKHKTKNHADTTPAQAIALLNHSLLQHRHPPNAVNRNPNYLRVFLFFLVIIFCFCAFCFPLLFCFSAFVLLCFSASRLFCFSCFSASLLVCLAFLFLKFSLAAVPCFNTFFCYFCFLCFCFPLLLLSSAFVFLCFSASLIVCFAFVFFNFLLAVLSCFSICFFYFCAVAFLCFSASLLFRFSCFSLFCFSASLTVCFALLFFKFLLAALPCWCFLF